MTIILKKIERLKSYKNNRNNKLLNNSLDKLKEVALDKKINIMPFIINAVENQATLGEISNALREVYGEYKEG